MVYFKKTTSEKRIQRFCHEKEQSLNVLKTEHDFHKFIHWTSQFLYMQSTNFA